VQVSSEEHLIPSGTVEFPEDTKGCKIVQVVAGAEHTLAILEKGEDRRIYGWGWNEHGNFGKGSNHLKDIMIPERIHPPGSGKVHSVL
jgi:alpha-tubulin suppressor-like RCC1 family protein